jgi:signal transduction histidine kinase/ActR/RegA family two-component response regulator
MQKTEQELWRPRDVARLLSLVEAEKRYYQEMMAVLPAGLGVFTPGGALAASNRAFRRMLGVEAERREEAVLASLLPTDSLRAAAQGVFGGKREPHAEVVKGEAGKWLRFTLRPFRDWDEQAGLELLVIVEDLTEAAMEAKEEAEGVHRELLSQVASLPGILWELDLATMRFRACDGVAAWSMGLPGGMWSGGAEFWSGRISPNDIAKVKGFYQLALGGGPVRSCDYRSAGRDGRTRWLRDYLSVVTNEAGAVVGLKGLTVDATPQYESERLAAQAERIDALHGLAGRIVHDSNNLLMILSGYGEELLHAIPHDSPLRSNVQEILNAGDRLSQLTSQLAAYTRREAEPESRLASVDALLAGWRERLSAAAGPHVQVVYDLGAPQARVSTDVERLRRGVEALVRRSAEAMPRGGVITISTTAVDRGHASAAAEAALGALRYVRIEVRDQGLPLSMGAAGQMFAPDVSADPQSVELASLYRFLRETGGDALVDNEPGVGTICTLYLPRVADVEAGAGEASAAVDPGQARETILIAEDEEGIRTLMRKVLAREGYRVIEAGGGEQALELARTHGGLIPLLISDVVMPGMGGVELASALAPVRPEMRVLFISGYTGQASLASAQLPQGYAFLQKPFTLAAFLKKVREVLDAPIARAAGV